MTLQIKELFFARDVIIRESQPIVLEKECIDDASIQKKSTENSIIIEQPEDNVNDSETSSSNTRRSHRLVSAPNRYGEWVYSSVCQERDPLTVEEALSGPDAGHWQQAMQNEMDSINSNNEWTLTDSSNNEKCIDTKWVFKKKYGDDGSLCSYKARLVAQGFAQMKGLNYDDTISPVVCFESIRTLLSLAAQHNLHLHQMDVSSAFLQGEYMMKYISSNLINLFNIINKTTFAN